MRLPPLNALRSFESAGRHLSLRKAAQELHVTPAAISHQVKALEQTLELSLFKRLPRRVVLTPAGEVFLPLLSDAFERMTEAVTAVKRLQGSGRVTIGAPPALASKWLAPRLHSFMALHPEIDLRISADESFIDGAGAESGEPTVMADTDIAIRSGSGDYPDHVSRLLFSAYALPMCSPRLLAGEHPLRAPEDLRHHTLLHYQFDFDDSRSDRPTWAAWLKAAGLGDIEPRRGPTFNQVAMAIEAAADGLGVVLGIPVIAAADLAAGRLLMPFALSMPVGADYHLVHSADAAREPAVAVFRDWLIAEAHGERWAHPPDASQCLT